MQLSMIRALTDEVRLANSHALTLVNASQTSGSPLRSSHASLATNKTVACRMEDGVTGHGWSMQAMTSRASIVASRIHR